MRERHPDEPAAAPGPWLVVPLPLWQAGLFAVLVTLATLGARLALDGPLGGRPTLVIFTVPIMLSAYVGGVGAGLLSTALSYCLASYFLLPPIHSFEVASGVDRLQQFFVVLAGVVISVLNEALHRTRRRADAAHRELRDSEVRLRAVTEHLSEGLIISDMHGNVLHWNRAGLAIHGYHDIEEGRRRLGEFADTFELSTLAGEVLPVERWPLGRILAGETLRDVCLRLRRHDGSLERVLSYSGAVVRYASERNLVFLSISDITESQASQARLREQLLRLRLLDQITRAIGERQDLASIHQVASKALEDQLPADFSGVMSADDADHQLLTVASAGARGPGAVLALGERFPSDDASVSRCLAGELVYEPDTAAMTCELARRLESAGLRSLVLAPLQSESRVFGILLAARREVRGFNSAECEFVRQLSAHVALAAQQARLHDELRGAFDELRKTQQAVMQQERLRALGQMASGIAHDINNAITPAVLYVESLLEHEVLSDRAREQLTLIAHAVDDVAATVARMREFYRAREAHPMLAPLALNGLVVQVIELSRARWSDMPQRRGVVIRTATELDAALPPVMGVESEIREALINLVFNAVDAMPAGGALTLRTRVLAPTGEASPKGVGQVALEVADTGVGMDAGTRRRCLEPFFTTKGERGTGLGLAMVYGTAQRHGAAIEFDSAPGQGTVARIVFTAAAAVPAAPVEEPGRPPAGMRVLLVDDDPALLHSLRDILEGDGHAAESANGGQAGIEAFGAACDADRPHDVVITDLGMPHVDGRAVAVAVKRRSPATPVILLTGWGQRMVEDGEMPDGVDLVLGKPPRLRELRAALSRCSRTRAG